jgi:hypothetical protein
MVPRNVVLAEGCKVSMSQFLRSVRYEIAMKFAFFKSNALHFRNPDTGSRFGPRWKLI